MKMKRPKLHSFNTLVTKSEPTTTGYFLEAQLETPFLLKKYTEVQFKKGNLPN